MFALSLFLLAADPAKLPNDAELTKMIGGKLWNEEHKLANGNSGKGITGFKEDGKFGAFVVWTRVIDGKEAFKEVRVVGTWKVENGHLVHVVEICDPPELKKGHTTRDKIISVDAKTLKIKDDKGQITEMTIFKP